MALTYAQANYFLSKINGSDTSSPLFMGLSTTAPGRDGSGVTEPDASAGYERKQIRQGQMKDPANGITSNAETLYFAEATGDWGVCTYFCLFTGKTGNNLIAFGALPTSIHPVAGKVPLIRYVNGQGQFSMTM